MTATSTWRVRVVVLIAGAALLLAGCAPRFDLARVTSTDAAGPGSAASDVARHTCRRTFPDQVLLGWAPTTVGRMRAYQFSGPVAQRPLRDAFAASAGARRGAWCLLRTGATSASLWAALGPGQRQHAITISGPRAARRLGPMRQPPRVP